MVFLGYIALLCGVVGWLWIVVLAFSEGETLWGIGSLIIPLVALIFGIMNFEETKIPLLLMGIGFVGRVGLAMMTMQGG